MESQNFILDRLQKENDALRQEIRRLEIFRNMAFKDHLTDLYNRRYFEERLQQELARARRWEWACSLMLIDVDDFKHINDTYGHSKGDEVLVRMSEVLRRGIREIDVGCRIGGDEFAVVLPCTDREGVLKVVKRVRERMEKRNLPVSASFGVATFPVDAQDLSALVATADEGMYLDKRKRKVVKKVEVLAANRRLRRG